MADESWESNLKCVVSKVHTIQNGTDNMLTNVPIKSLPVVERWDCHNCGNCCRGSIVRLDQADVKRLRDQKWFEHPDYRDTAVYVRNRWLGGGYRLAHRDDGSCVFLMDDGLCRVHAEFGYEAKPAYCRTYPLQLVPWDRFAYLTIRRSCPSAACDKGRPIREHRQRFTRLLQKNSRRKSVSLQPLRLTRRYQGSWADATCVANVLERLLTDSRFPMVRRVVHALQFCDLLDSCKLKKFRNGRLIELANILQQSCLTNAGVWFRDRRPPGRATAMLFRQVAAQYVRLHPGFRAEKTWRTRLCFAQAAFVFARGKGAVPAIHHGFPAATFESLERELGPLDDSISQPLDRYLENSAMSKQYAILDRSHWTLVDSFRSLALTFPVALWMLRWATGNRKPTQDDLLDVLTAIDRAQGYASLSRQQHRGTVRTIARLGELPRLVAWYAR